MNKLMRHLTTTGIAAVAAGGALLAGGGSAVAATTPQHGGRAHCPPAVAAGHGVSRRSPAHQHIDPWVLDQLRVFDPAAARRITVFDPWVRGQLAQFEGQAARPDGQGS
ncbi:hypothetical protein ABZ719_00705 [Streptomyces sp. NPDC006743]|uniref:hypothetical protein n=1 Tax=Streptomyces sp. NPDC006743 TaxID=3154480 RepID=UPI0034538F7B